MSNLAQGIDLSGNNGVFDWVAWNGHIEFAMIKATEGTWFHDPQFTRNWAGAKHIGVHRFAYHYGHPDRDPSVQAQMFVKAVLNAGWEPGDGFVLDLEKNYGAAREDWGRTPVQISFWAWVFCREVGRLMKSRGHYHTFVYANPDVINLGWCHMLAGYRLWVADYGVPHPPMPLGPWRTWTFWQRSGAAPLDLDVFNGTPEQLQALVSW